MLSKSRLLIIIDFKIKKKYLISLLQIRDIIFIYKIGI